MKPEPLLAALNELRKELGEDHADPQWLAVHHAFCFLSYRMREFSQYLDEADRRGEFDEYKQDQDAN